MHASRNLRSRAGGFTLIEILVALALVTGLTLMMFQAVAPWMNLRQKTETERRLEQVQSALEMAYRVNAMQIEGQAGAVLRRPLFGGLDERGEADRHDRGDVDQQQGTTDEEERPGDGDRDDGRSQDIEHERPVSRRVHRWTSRRG